MKADRSGRYNANVRTPGILLKTEGTIARTSEREDGDGGGRRNPDAKSREYASAPAAAARAQCKPLPPPPSSSRSKFLVSFNKPCKVLTGH